MSNLETKKKLLTITNLRKYFPLKKASIFDKEQLYVRANDDVSLDIYEGETVGIVGESGCGKSTFGRVLLQLYPQTSGSVMYYGTTLEKVAPKYVEYTLKHGHKMIKHYFDLKKKADLLEEKCKGREDELSYAEANARDTARFEAQNALDRVVKIFGGFMVDAQAISDFSVERHALNIIRRKKLLAEDKHRTLVIDKDKAETRLLKKGLTPEEVAKDKSMLKFDKEIEKASEEIERYGKENSEMIQKLDALVEKYRSYPNFEFYEAMRDDGVDLARLTYPEIRLLRKDLQIIFQDPYSSLDPRMTIGNIIQEGIITHKMFRKGSQKLQDYTINHMEKCGLPGYMVYRFPHQFSGGQRQRICIARALAVQPKFVVCDECVSALDVSIQSQILNLLQDLKEQQGLTYLFISHDLSVVKYISDRIGVMYLGNLVELGDTETIFRDPRHPYTVALLSAIPTTDIDSLDKERIILEGNIPSPIRPPKGCKFHTRCYMATEKCSRITPPLVDLGDGHFCACHYPDAKLNESGEFLFSLKKENKEVKNVLHAQNTEA